MVHDYDSIIVFGTKPKYYDIVHYTVSNTCQVGEENTHNDLDN